MKKNISRNILYAAGIVLLFLAISYAFVPEVLGGKIVNQSDISGWTGMTNEVITYNEAHPDDPSFWTNSSGRRTAGLTWKEKHRPRRQRLLL